MPQLDGLRALAVFSVMIHHFLDLKLLPGFVASLPWGLAGVRLFFVLSGFLITSILLDARSAIASGQETWGQAIRRFFFRRTLRIFPLNYLILAVAFLFGPPDAQEQLPWLATYTYNIWVSWQGWFGAYFSHFWSLSVEEQFYLFWPWVVLLAPKRRLVALTLGMIMIAPLYRWIAIAGGLNGVAIYAFTFSSFDALGLGALLAMLSGAGTSPRILRAWHWSLFALGLGGTLALQSQLLSTKGTLLHGVMFESCLALAFAWLISKASQGRGGLWKYVLANRAVVYLGKISYGIYVYHLFMGYLVPPMLNEIGIVLPRGGWAEFGVLCAATVLVASASWHLFEAPVNRLKDRLQPAARPAASFPGSGSV